MHFFFVSPFLFSFFERRASRGFPLRPKKAPTFLFSAGVSSLSLFYFFFVGRWTNEKFGCVCVVVEPTQKRGKVATAQKKRTCCQINSPSLLPINWTREEREGSFIVFSSVREKVKGRKHHAAATVNASAPVAAEVFLVEDSKTNAVFYFPARGFWSQEFLARFRTRVHGNV